MGRNRNPSVLWRYMYYMYTHKCKYDTLQRALRILIANTRGLHCISQREYIHKESRRIQVIGTMTQYPFR